MPHKMFLTSDTNPNETTGGGGCLCDPIKQADCKPPYVIFPGNDMENIASPHVVACYECLRAAAEACFGEIGGAGEDSSPLDSHSTRLRAQVEVASKLRAVPELATIAENDEDGPRI